MIVNWVLEEHTPTLEKLGVPMPERPVVLGEGCYATTFATLDNRVVKITADKAEQSAAELVRLGQVRRGAPFHHIIRIDHVFRIDHDRYQTLTVAERLQEIPQAWWEPQGYCLNPFVYHHHMPRVPAKWCGYYRADIDDYVSELRDYHGDERAHMWGRIARARKGNPVIDIILDGMARELTEVGIDAACDLHSQNVMARPDGSIVISDLGETSSRKVLPRFIQDALLHESA